MPNLSKYHEIPTHMTISEKDKLFELVTRTRNKSPRVVEIGSFLGASSCFIAEALKGFGCTGKLHCVDTWMNDAMDNVPKRDVYAEFLINTRDFKEQIIPHRGISGQVAKTFKQEIDIIFFDGNHSYEGVAEDWHCWGPKLSPGTLVIFHDWGWSVGVKRVILEEVHPVVKYFDTLPNMWWGWLRG